MAKSRRYYPKRRSIRKRRKYTRRIKRRGRKSKYAKTRSIGLTRTINRIPPTAFTNFKHRTSTRSALFSVFSDPSTGPTGSINTCESYVFRANDIVNPICKNGDQTGQGGTWETSIGAERTSVCGLNRVAPLYGKHQVLRYGLRAAFTFRMSGPDQLTSIPRLFIAWRISDECPLYPTAATPGDTCFEDVVHRRGVGWRYKEVRNLQMNRNRTVKIGVSIPINKFYKYSLTDLDALKSVTCATPDGSASGGWTSPSNPCYMQMIVFVKHWETNITYVPRFQDMGNPKSPASASSVSEAGQYFIGYTLQLTQSFWTKSTERDPDISIQSPTTDGGLDVGSEEDVARAVTQTWSAIDDVDDTDIALDT